MSLSKRHHHIQVVLKTVDHLWYNQITGLVILWWKNKQIKKYPQQAFGIYYAAVCK